MPETYETQNTDEAICPYCGHVEMDTWEVRPQNDGDSDTVDCETCDERYEITTHVVVTVSTRRMDCADGNHIYDTPDRSDYPKGWQAKHMRNPAPPKKEASSIWGRNCIHCEEMDVKRVGYKGPMPDDWKPETVVVDQNA